MLRSLYTATSGIKSHQELMDIKANNISNVNTTAYKADSVSFKDLMYQSSKRPTAATQTTASSNAIQTGLGTNVGSVTKSVLQQGSGMNTEQPLDMMITGDSFFIVQGNGETAFTRDGSFNLDVNGDLVMQNTGYYVYGWTSTDGTTVNKASALGKLNFRQGQTDPTMHITLRGNIDDDDVDIHNGGAFRTVEVTDKVGNVYKMTMKITENGNGTYDLTISDMEKADGSSVDVTGAKSIRMTYDYETGEFISANGNTDGIVKLDVPTIGNVSFDLSGTTAISSMKDNVRIAGSLPDWVKISNIDSEGAQDYLSDTDKIHIKTADGTEGDYIASRISLGGDKFNKSELLNCGFYSTCCTCFAHYSIRFNSGEGNSITQSGGHKIYNVDIADANSPEEVIDAIISGINEIDGRDASDVANPGGHFTSLIKDPDDPTTIIIYDNRDQSEGSVYGYYPLNSGNGFGKIGAGYAMAKDTDKKKLEVIVSADGGTITGYEVQKNGMVYATFSNGSEPRLIGQIAVAEFPNPYGLESEGSNLYHESQNSGSMRAYDVEELGGSIDTGVLEMSNVNLADEFIGTILAQRGLQASSRVITVSDHMLELLRDLKQ